MTIKVCIDIHEQEATIQKVRSKLIESGYEVEVAEYEVADLFVGNVLGIERKTPDDFIGSVTGGGRIFQQAYELKENFTNPVIVVDGAMEQVLYNRYSPNPASMMAAVASLYVHYHVPVFFCGQGNYIWAVQNLISKSVDGKVPSYTPIRKAAPIKDQQLSLMCGIPGLGPKKAKKVLEAYHTPLNAFINWERWPNDVDGIGGGIKDKVGKLLTEGSG